MTGGTIRNLCGPCETGTLRKGPRKRGFYRITKTVGKVQKRVYSEVKSYLIRTG